MASLFDALDDIDSFELYYDSDLEALRDAWEESSDEGNYPDNSDEEDPFGGPDEEDPEPIWEESLTPSTSSSSTSLPLHHP